MLSRSAFFQGFSKRAPLRPVPVLQALINPLPSLGVAWEVRPGLLKAMSSDERVRLAVAAIKASIEHLQGRGGAARE